MFKRDITRFNYLKYALPENNLLHPLLQKSLQQNGVTHLTELQQRALPTLLSGKDTLIQGETSSGKTMAYLLPIL